jgi:hypothetical protein
MIDFLAITNQADFAQRCDQMPGMRIFVDLERNGKAERQAGRNTFISTHQMCDVSAIRTVVRRSPLMVRVNPYQPSNPNTNEAEVDEILAAGADLLMLPMFTNASELQSFIGLVAGRAPVVALLETAGALASLDEWIATPGLHEVFVGLNDLHLSLGHRFMFEPLLRGHVERVAVAAHQQNLRFGFGGIARVGEGQLPGQDVLAEHLRLGSRAVILSRTFSGGGEGLSFRQGIQELRKAEQALGARTVAQVEADRARIAGLIRQLAESVGQGA